MEDAARRTRLTRGERSHIRSLYRAGRSRRDIAAEVGRSRVAVAEVVAAYRSGTAALADWQPAEGRLTLADREEIGLGLARGETFTHLAARLARAVSTVSREVAANGGHRGYRASEAHRRAWERSRRPKPCKLADPALAAVVGGWLTELWSPQQIARRLRTEFPDDPMMRVSHETVYRSLYVQGRGELRTRIEVLNRRLSRRLVEERPG